MSLKDVLKSDDAQAYSRLANFVMPVLFAVIAYFASQAISDAREKIDRLEIKAAARDVDVQVLQTSVTLGRANRDAQAAAAKDSMSALDTKIDALSLQINAINISLESLRTVIQERVPRQTDVNPPRN